MSEKVGNPENPTEPSPPDGPKKSPEGKLNLSRAREFVKDKPVLHAFWTMGYFLVHPYRFAKEVMTENWTDKMKPVRFFFESLAIVSIFYLLINWSMKWEKDLLIPPDDPTETSTQKFAEQILANGVSFVACLAAASVFHFLVGRKRYKYRQTLSLSIYINGATDMALAAFAVVITNPPRIFPGQAIELQMLAGVSELVVTLGVAWFYWVAPISKIYRRHWITVIGAGLVGLVGYLIIAVPMALAVAWLLTKLP